MSEAKGDPFDDPAWKRYADQAREKLEPMVRDSHVAVSLYGGEIDPKLAIEMGYMILLDKPIIAVVAPGSKAPDKLVQVADEIVELALDDPSFNERLMAAVGRVMAKQEQEGKQ